MNLDPHPIDLLGVAIGFLLGVALRGWWRANRRLERYLAIRPTWPAIPGREEDPQWVEARRLLAEPLAAMFLLPVAPAILAVGLLVAWLGLR